MVKPFPELRRVAHDLQAQLQIPAWKRAFEDLVEFTRSAICNGIATTSEARETLGAVECYEVVNRQSTCGIDITDSFYIGHTAEITITTPDGRGPRQCIVPDGLGVWTYV